MIVKTQRSATIGIFHNNKVLLLKRGSTAPWQPNKYCLPGGGKDGDESLEQTVRRETLEETGLLLDSLVSCTISYKNNSSKVVFASRIFNPNVILNYEHSEYFWASYDEILNLYRNKNLVPYLITTLGYFKDQGYLS